MEEQWKEIRHYYNYEVSSLGRVRNLAFGKLLNPRLIKSGYYIVDLSRDKKPSSFYVHKLVADAFIEHEEYETHVIHIDGNKLNNSVDNLAWTTRGYARSYAYRFYEKKSVKDHLDKEDIEVSHSTSINDSLLDKLFFKYEGKFYKLYSFGDTLGFVYKTKKDNGKAVVKNVAKEILLRHVGEPPSEDHQVGYKDFDPKNISLHNLIWETKSEKILRYRKFSPIKFKINDIKLGQRSTSRIMNREMTKKRVNKMLANGINKKVIAKRIGVSYVTLLKYIKKWEKEKNTSQI